MQFARDRGELSPRVSIRDVLARAIGMRAFFIRRAGLVLRFDAATAPPAHVQGRSTRLLQAVLNLIINAEQALQGTGRGTIEVELLEADRDAVLRICDTGSGLDPEVAHRVFEPFVTTRPAPDATGLGLTAARIIARTHGGDVTVEPRAPGCCATLRLPLASPPP